MVKKLVGVVLITAMIAIYFAACCSDDEKINPVSEDAIDGASCSNFTVDGSGNTGELIGTYYSGEYSKISILWGDNSSLQTIEPSQAEKDAIAYHSYNTAGTYHLTATLYDKRGYPCECSKWIVINTNNNNNTTTVFNITATPSYGKPTLNVNFTYAFSASDGATCSSIDWNFGDSQTATGLGTSHQYTATGTYEVTATATDSLSRISKAYATVTVSDNPYTPDPGNQSPSVTISSDITTVDVRGTVKFTANATDPDGTISNYEWVLGGGLSESGATKTTLSHEYYNTSGGSYQAYCIVTDDDGATAQSNTITITVKANEKPVVVSEVNGEPWNTPEVEEGETVLLDICGSTDSNVGDSIKKWEYTTSAGLSPLSGSSTTNCTFSPTSVGTGEKSVEFHVTDSYGQASNAQSRKFNVIKTAHCTITNVTSSKVYAQYAISSGTCSPYLTSSQYANPSWGVTLGRGCPVTYGTKNILTEGSGTYTLTWTMTINATDCDSDDTFTVTTELTNNCGGGDVNNDIYIPNVKPNVANTYSVTLNGGCTNTNRRWSFKVNGDEWYYNILDSVNAH